MNAGPTFELTGGGVLVALALLVGGVVAYKAFKAGSGLLGDAGAAIGQAYDQTTANVQSAWVNNVQAPFLQGQAWVDAGQPVNVSPSFNELMYGNYGYTGQQGGQVVTDGEWLSDEEARRYSAAQLTSGATPPAQSNNGAAFGVYRKP